MESVVSIIDLLCSYRTLRDSVLRNESSVIKDIMSTESTRYMVYPCDIIDLRSICSSKIIVGKFPILLFSLKFSQKYLKDYSVFLILDSEKIMVDNKKSGSIRVFYTDRIDIDEKLSRIIVNNTSNMEYFNNVKKIVEECKISAECLLSNSIPGIESRSSVILKSKKTGQSINNISLNADEKSIFDLLVKVKQEYNIPTEFRVAGGWVRDRLLGVPSDDIDIAVSMPGYIVAKMISDYGMRHGIKDIGEAYKVSLEKSADPNQREQQSDELLVGGISVFGKKIEFVPMRTEFYPDPNSRIPSITTTDSPEEDSKRRDLTINAMYYNVESKKIEDYVGGLKDLGTNGNSMILKTPDDPTNTFLEDPLRVLRLLRFHSRYPQSVIDPNVMTAVNNPAVREAYIKKVAPERAGKEIMKIMSGENPVRALKILFETEFYKSVFRVPSMEDLNSDGILMDQRTPHHKYNLLDHTLSVVSNLNNIMKQNNESDYMRGLMNFAALFHDFGKMKKNIATPHPNNENQMQYLGHEDESTIMADEILKSIGVGKDDREIVTQVIAHHMKPHNADEWSNRTKGRFLRDTKLPGKEEEHKDLWKYILYHVKADQMSSSPEKFDPNKFQKTFDSFQSFVQSPSGSAPKPILNGFEIMNIFKGLDPSTGYIKEVQERLIEAQDSGDIDISYVQMPKSGERDSLERAAKEKATSFLMSIAPDIISKYKEPQKMATNWFKKVVSQAIPDGVSPSQKDPEIVKGPKIQPPKYEVGMLVRDRRKGIVNPQEYGKVVSIKGNNITIEWNPNDKKNKIKQVLDMVEDTAILSFIVGEV